MSEVVERTVTEIVRRAARVGNCAIWTGPRSHAFGDPIAMVRMPDGRDKTVNVMPFLWEFTYGERAPRGEFWLFRSTCAVENGICVQPEHMERAQVLSFDEFRAGLRAAKDARAARRGR